MKENVTTKCDCGQTNYLVLLDGLWRYDAAKHGSNADSVGKCFNCHQPLKEHLSKLEPKPKSKPKTKPKSKLETEPQARVGAGAKEQKETERT